MSSKQSLNEKQLEASLNLNGPLLILAGAGAGKTKTITERVVEIVKSGIDPRNILCVTFTNKAAKEMRERILHRLEEEKLYDEYTIPPTIKTFHSLGLWILKKESEYAGLKKDFVILDSADSRGLVKSILEELSYDTKVYEPTKIRNAISREKGDFIDVKDYAAKANSFTMEVVTMVWKRYEEELRSQGAVDFDDLIVRVVNMLRENSVVREKYQNLFKYIHIDEYQDTNNSQYEFTKLLVNPETNNICVVGDTDQNIYSWRGANLKNIMSFEKDFSENKNGGKFKVHNVLLEENYRSTGNILNVANTAIRKNTIRKDKNLFTNAGDGEEIEIMPAWDGDSEAECVALKCKEIISEGVSPNNIAVLYRTNFQSRAIEEKMLNHNVEYIVLGTRFFERKEVKDMMSYLKCALNPESLIDLKRVFETPKRGIGKTTIAKVFAREELPNAANKKVNEVMMFLEKIKSESLVLPLGELFTYILVESGIEKELKDDGEEGMERLANISELITLAEKYDNLDEFLELASLSSDQDDDKKELEGVRLMTIHASKGLEFEYVFIVGLEEDLFPSKNFSGKKRSKEEEEEERRLFYVAVTRARKKLYLSFAEMRQIFGQTNIAAPSQFLLDVPDDISTYHDMYYKKHERGGKIVYI